MFFALTQSEKELKLKKDASWRLMVSYGRGFLCPRRDLNPRPLPYQGSALPLSYKGLWKDGPGWI